VATFSNGQKRVEAQLALASIQNPTSLQNAGNNNFATTSDTATPAIGIPQTADRGQILGGALEGSNVDMATEFTNLIVFQSAYQANSRVISTADQMNQDLFNVIH
jgi:flagellar hook protein FlgE